MKITYLVNQIQPDGSTLLCVATHEAWRKVVDANRTLSLEDRRYFIRDCIMDCGEQDWLIYEVSRDEYLKWDRRRKVEERNRSLGEKFEFLSSDMFMSIEGKTLKAEDTLISDIQVEDIVCDRLTIKELRRQLAAWKPWANDLLDLYLAGKKKSCTEIIAKKFGVSQQTARKYKRQFEKFIKKFEQGVSF